ncbi:MAG: DUF547 domain-containing protein [Burkholderiales bacterium]
MNEPESPALTLSRALEAARERHCDAEGLRCDYAALRRAPEGKALAAALAGLEDFDPRCAPIPGPIGFWLNAYNACALLAALDAAPGENVHRIERFYERARVCVTGQAYSLDDIEHGLLRGNAHRHGRLRGPLARDDPRLAFTPLIFDERIHFALYAACRSTPALRVYHAGRLEAELEDAARDHLRRGVRVEHGGALVVAPPQLHWYARDFGGEPGALEFVLARIEDEAAIELIDRRQGRVKLRYAEFDWTLNQRPSYCQPT